MVLGGHTYVTQERAIIPRRGVQHNTAGWGVTKRRIDVMSTRHYEIPKLRDDGHDPLA
jgi:hypothetical protein